MVGPKVLDGLHALDVVPRPARSFWLALLCRVHLRLERLSVRQLVGRYLACFPLSLVAHMVVTNSLCVLPHGNACHLQSV